jgi:glutaredoxin
MIILYSKNHCAHCASAKDYLHRLNIEFQEVNIEHDPEARTFIIGQGLRTVPQIFLDGNILIPGGWSALSRMTADDIHAAMDRATPTSLGTI